MRPFLTIMEMNTMKTQQSLLKTVLLSALVVGSSSLLAETVPYQFEAGQPAKAAEVNANFANVVERIDTTNTEVSDLSDRVDVLENASSSTDEGVWTFTAYTTLTGRTMTNVKDESGCNRRVDQFVFDSQANTLAQTVDFQYADGSVCDSGWSQLEYLYQLDRGGLYTDIVNGVIGDDENIAIYQSTLTPGWALLKSAMRVGESWGNLHDVSMSYNGITSVVQQLRQSTFIGYQDVTVPSGTYTNCAVVLGGTRVLGQENITDTVSFFCPEVGLTRYIDMAAGADWQMTSVTLSE
jgi:hypothetical protein